MYFSSIDETSDDAHGQHADVAGADHRLDPPISHVQLEVHPAPKTNSTQPAIFVYRKNKKRSLARARG